MQQSGRRTTAFFTVLALVALSFSGTVWAEGPSARLEGQVIGLDGRPADGYRVHLIQADGTAVSATDVTEGAYGFKDLPAGDYQIGVENESGAMAPVVGAPVRLAPGSLARRDVKLLEANAETQQDALTANYGLSSWWGSLSAAGKTWTVVGILVGGAIVASAFNSDDSETNASEDMLGK